MAKPSILIRTPEIKTLPGRALSFNDDTGVVEMLPSITNLVDQGGDIILPGAYAASIKAGRKPKMLAGHDWGRVTGRIIGMEEWLPGDRRLPHDLLKKGAGALWTQGRYNLRSTEGKEAYERVRFLSGADGLDESWNDGTGAEWSIGYDCSGKTAEGEAKAWRDTKSGLRYIKSLDLLEISDVVVGMAPGTRSLSVKDLLTALRDAPMSKVFSFAELAYKASDAGGQEETDDSEGSTIAEVTPYGKEPNYEPEDAAGAGSDLNVLSVNGEEGMADSADQGNLTSQESEDSYDDGGPKKPGEKRLTAAEWLQVLSLQVKDWDDFDANRPAGPGKQSSKPINDQNEDDKPSDDQDQQDSGGKPTSTSSTPSNPVGAAPAPPPNPQSPAPKPEGGGEGGEGGGVMEMARGFLEQAHEAITEGREVGKEKAEEFASHDASVVPFKSRSIGEVGFNTLGEMKDWSVFDAARGGSDGHTSGGGGGIHHSFLIHETHDGVRANATGLSLNDARDYAHENGYRLKSVDVDVQGNHLGEQDITDSGTPNGPTDWTEQALREYQDPNRLSDFKPAESPSKPGLLNRLTGGHFGKSAIGEVRFGAWGQTKDTDGYQDDDDGVDNNEPEDANLNHGQDDGDDDGDDDGNPDQENTTWNNRGKRTSPMSQSTMKGLRVLELKYLLRG